MLQITVLPSGERKFANWSSMGLNVTVGDYEAHSEVRNAVVALWHPEDFSKGLDEAIRAGRFAPDVFLFDAAVALRIEEQRENARR